MAAATDSGHERAHTDAGRTGDKIKALDPAAAPLETDAESSGHPTPLADALQSVRRLVDEVTGRSHGVTFGALRQPADAADQQRRGRVLMAWVAGLCLFGVALGVITWP